jgi:hypothetical protein
VRLNLKSCKEIKEKASLVRATAASTRAGSTLHLKRTPHAIGAVSEPTINSKPEAVRRYPYSPLATNLSG